MAMISQFPRDKKNARVCARARDGKQHRNIALAACQLGAAWAGLRLLITSIQDRVGPLTWVVRCFFVFVPAKVTVNRRKPVHPCRRTPPLCIQIAAATAKLLGNAPARGRAEGSAAGISPSIQPAGQRRPSESESGDSHRFLMLIRDVIRSISRQESNRRVCVHIDVFHISCAPRETAKSRRRSGRPAFFRSASFASLLARDTAYCARSDEDRRPSQGQTYWGGLI